MDGGSGYLHVEHLMKGWHFEAGKGCHEQRWTISTADRHQCQHSYFRQWGTQVGDGNQEIILQWRTWEAQMMPCHMLREMAAGGYGFWHLMRLRLVEMRSCNSSWDCSGKDQQYIVVVLHLRAKTSDCIHNCIARVVLERVARMQCTYLRLDQTLPICVINHL